MIMSNILDIHTHRPAPQPDALICVRPEDFNPVEGQLYSVGIHPWETVGKIPEETWSLLEKVAAHPQVRAIGECGIDHLKGGPLYLQMQVMKRQIDLAEKLGKPLVIHNVQAHDIIIGMKKDLNPKQNWMVHGFRGKPTIGKMLADVGIWVSFGPKFNEHSVKEIPDNLILAETDDSEMTIGEVITALSTFAGRDITDVIVRNSASFLSTI